MATELAVGYVSLIPSARGFGSNVAKELDGVQAVADDVGQKAGGRFSGAFKSKLKIGAAIGGALAAAAATDFIGDSISAASDLEESASKVAQVFGNQTTTIQQFASTAATSLGQSQQQALEAAGTFGNLFTSMGLSQDAAAGMSTEVVTLASDLASFNNLAPEEALEKLRAGLVGEVEPLRALGVNFNAAEVEAKAMAMGLADANGEISESSKVQARMALIMEKTTNAQGDFARTSDGLANKQRIASAQFKDLQAKIGSALLPTMTKLMGFVSSKLIPGMTKVGEIIGKVGGFIGDNIEYFIALGVGIMSVLVPALVAQATAGLAAAAAGLAVAAAWIAANAPIIAAAAAVAALVAGVIWAYQNVEVFRNAIDAVVRFVKSSLIPTIQSIANKFVEVGSTVGEKVGEIVGFVTGIPGRIASTVSTMWNGIRDGITSAKDWVSARINDIVGFISGMGSRITSAASGMWNGITSAFKAAINTLIRGWNGLEFKIPGFKIGPIGYDGFTLGVPDVPTLHTGGIYQAPMGASEGLAMLQSGERVLSRAQTRAYDAGMGKGGHTIIVNNPVREASEDSVRRELKRIQLMAV